MASLDAILSGPWEVFQDTAVPDTESPAFRLDTVSDSRKSRRRNDGRGWLT